MTEPQHIECGVQAMKQAAMDLFGEEFEPKDEDYLVVRRILDAAFAELAANPPEEAVKALHDTYIDTVDRFDAMNEFRAALSAAFSALRNTHGD